MSSDRELRAALAEVWPRVRWVATERLELLIRTVCALEHRRLTDEERDEALRAAHKLVGALGTYGFPDGSTTARRAEALLAADSAPTEVVDDLVGELMALRGRLDRGPDRG